MDIGDLVHGPFDTREYIEYLGGLFGHAFTFDTYSMLPQFFGHEEEDPCLHLDRFEAVCGLCDDIRMSKRLRFLFFPLSLQSVAGDWCYDFGEWTTWDQCVETFIEHFLPIHQTFTHGFQIRNFSQMKGEVFSKCWERFNILLNTFPSHGLELGDIIAILYNALSHELHQEFDIVLGKEFLNLTPGEAWSFLEFFYEHTMPRERLEPSFEPYTLDSHTDLFPHAPTSLDPHDPSLGSSVCGEPTYSDFACPNLVPLTEGQSEEPLDYWPCEPNEAQIEDIMYELLQKQKEQLARLTPAMSMTESSSSDIAIGTEWDNYPNYTGDHIGNKHPLHSPLDSPIQEISLPSFGSPGDMQSFPTTEFDAQPTQTTPGPIESLLTPFEQLQVPMPEEHIIESVSPCSLTYAPEVESGAQFSPLDSAPPTKFTLGIMSDHVIDPHWGEVVDIGDEYIDFLGIECLIEPAMSMSMSLHALWPHSRFQGPHLAFHPLVCFSPKERPPSVLCEPDENIFFLKPFVDAWDREGVG